MEKHLVVNEILDKSHQLCHSCDSFSHMLWLKPGEKQINVGKKDPIIVFLLQGHLSIQFVTETEKDLSDNEMITLSPASIISITALKNSQVLIVSFKKEYCFQGGDIMPQINFFDPSHKARGTYHPLVIHKRIKEYLIFFGKLLEDGLDCPNFFYIKIMELLFLMQTYYSPQDIFMFFSHIMEKEDFFVNQVMKYHNEVRTAKELAEKMNCSFSSFQVKFEKTFSMPVYRWMQKQKAERVLNDLSNEERTIKEISISNRFSTLARFYEFCKKSYGMTPLEVQKKTHKGEKIHILI